MSWIKEILDVGVEVIDWYRDYRQDQRIRKAERILRSTLPEIEAGMARLEAIRRRDNERKKS